MQTVDFTSVTGLDGAANVYLRCTLTGASSSGGNNRLDNVQLNATGGVTPTGACCNGTGCTIETESDCLNVVFGRYQGNGTTCLDGDNNNVCDCRTIQAARNAANGSGFVLCNVIVSNSIDSIASAAVKSFQVQDTSGPSGAARAITVFGSAALIDSVLGGVNAGDQIDLRGMTSTFQGLLELVDGTGTNSSPQPLLRDANDGPVGVPAPVVITTSDMQTGAPNAEAFESVRVKLECVQFTPAGGTFAGETNYTVTDGVNTATVRVPTVDINVVGDAIPLGNVGLIGILTQSDSSAPFDGGYQLLLLNETDIVAATNCPPDPTGACCLPIGVCNETTEAICNSAGGAFQGTGTTCPDPDCVATVGACCVDGVCSEMSEAACTTAGGVFSGLGTPCANVVCCGDITDARLASNEGQNPTGFTLCEVVVADITDLVGSANSKSFVAQDASCPNGAIGSRGVNFFGSNAAIDAVTAMAPPGTRLQIEGDAIQFNGLFQMSTPFTFTVLGSTTPPAPAVIGAQDVADGSATAECYESRLVTINCLTFEIPANPNFDGPQNLIARDAANNPVTIRIQRGDMDFEGTPIPTTPVNITGVLGQFDATPPLDGGYQLLPRALADLTPCTVTCACPGDIDASTTRNGRDVQGFVDCLLGGGSNCDCADVDGNPGVTTADIPVFVNTIINSPTCP